ncbi:MAG: hypothetical protein QME52_13410 [Bacteroidota bacterium]|nr:hypothetical protein [Bacteroidota bacterium]
MNQGIYRLYSDADPSLAKILRNIKIAVGTLKNFTEVERFGEPCIVPSLCDSLEDRPAIEREFLEQQFIKHTTGREHIPELLAKLSLFLREQNEHCRMIPFMMVGVLFRTIYTCRYEFQDQVVSVDAELVESDTSAIIKKVCYDVRKKNEWKYVDGGKVTADMFEKYFQVLEEELCEKFIGKDGYDFSLFESLKKLSPDLLKEDYKKNHRNKIEYLLKQVNKEVVKRLKGV